MCRSIRSRDRGRQHNAHFCVYHTRTSTMRSGLMCHLYDVVIPGVLVVLFSRIDNVKSQCRCLPGDACWPTQADWTQLNTTLNGNLITPRPTGYSCYPGSGFDATTCQLLKQANTQASFVLNNPGSMQLANWEELGQMRCSIETSAIPNATCEQGRVSVYGVAATSTANIQDAMVFARQHNLRVVIKSSGHDFMGRNAIPGSFLIWLHKFTKIQTMMNFTPNGCDATQANGGPVVTVHGGTTWTEVLKQVDADFNGTYFVAGASGSTVGTTGAYIGGGGHSILSPTFGLAVDNVLEFQIVMVDGKLLTVNSCQNKDLFWALRGGGAGTYGVVVSVTYKIHALPLGYMAFSALVSNQDKSGSLNAQQMQSALEVIARHTDSLDSARWGGYFYSMPTHGLVLIFLTPRPESTVVETDAIIRMEAVRDELVGLQDQLSIAVSPISPNTGTDVNRYMRFIEWKNFFDTSPMGAPSGSISRLILYLGSRLIPKAAFSDPASVSQTVTAAIVKNSIQFGIAGHLVSGHGVRDHPNANETSVTPAWRRSAWLVVLNNAWSSNATDDQIQQTKWAVNAGVQVLRDAYPESGTFSNEAFPEEPEWQQTLWGDSYARLLEIKKSVDPDGFLICNECVGSELKDQSGNCPKETLIMSAYY